MLLMVVVLLIGSSFGQWEQPLLGPEYPQPEQPIKIPKVESVLPRLGASAACSNSYSYVTGGLAFLPSNWPQSFNQISQLTKEHAVSELNVYNSETNQFELNSEGVHYPSMSNKRAFHISAAFENAIYVWGGGSDIVEKYDIVSGQWSDVFVSGWAPEATYGAGAEASNNQIFVFGGRTESGDLSNELASFDIDSEKWIKHEPSTLDEPTGRYGASLNVYGQFIYVYGGVDSTGKTTSDLWAFDISSKVWTQMNIYSNETEEADNKISRAFHASIIVEGFLVVYLGENTQSEDYFPIIAYDIAEDSWMPVGDAQKSRKIPPVKSGFAYCAGTIFGGVRNTGSPLDTYSLNAEVWSINDDQSSFQRKRCYPGFVWDDILNVCAQPADEQCQLCETCNDLSSHQRSYIQKLKNKALQKDYSGLLRQCPAIWRRTEHVY